MQEAKKLKRAGVKQSLYIINAVDNEVDEIVKDGFELAVGSLEYIKLLETAAIRREKKAKVHLELNTGMGRFGVSKEDVVEAAKYLKNSKYFELLGFCTHFSCADKKDK